MSKIERCDICDAIVDGTTLEWNANLGWHGACRDCRPTIVTGGGRFTFIRVGG
jgi:hypothetical protein